MSGINWRHKGQPYTRKFWNVPSLYSTYLGQLFLDFEFEFNQSLDNNTKEFELSQTQTDYLIDGVEDRIESLLSRFNPVVPHGINYVTRAYKGTEYKLFVKMSDNHQLIYGLIRFHEFLLKTRSSDCSIIFWGGDFDSGEWK